MSSISYYPQQYKCPNCGKIQKHYIWSNEAEKAKHDCIGCETKLTVENEYEAPVNAAPAIKTPTGNKLMLAQRRKRNHDHFKREVLPSLTDKDDKKHHINKLGYKS